MIPQGAAAPLRFGDCLFDPGSRELTRGGVRQELSPKAFQFLELLLEAHPRALTKQEIHDRLWPDSFVSESSLPRLAAEVRAAIGDDARRPRLLRTLHRYGYAFCGAVGAAPNGTTPAPARCRLIWGERPIELIPGENILGRAAEARVFIDVARVSRHHARVTVTDGKAILEDMGSRNGTFLRGRRIAEPSQLADGDEICIGPVLLVFRSSSGDGTTESGTGA